MSTLQQGQSMDFLLSGVKTCQLPSHREFHVNHCGGTRSITLLKLSQEMWKWAYPKFLSLRARHPEVVHQTWDVFGEAQVHLFASADTTHCPLWLPEQEQDSPMRQDTLAHS